jgi:hypothetical protein
MASEKKTDRDGLIGKALSGITIAAVILLTAIETCNPDTSLLLLWFVVAPSLMAISIGALIYVIAPKSRGKRLRVLSTLAILWAFAACTYVFDLKHPSAIRSVARWFLWSHDYENEVLAQPNSADGEFKHIDWDGWGGFAQDTPVYLVYDPGDKLSAASGRQSGKYDGLPCKVRRISRLESHWYAVQFYTNQYWSDCHSS